LAYLPFKLFLVCFCQFLLFLALLLLRYRVLSRRVHFETHRKRRGRNAWHEQQQRDCEQQKFLPACIQIRFSQQRHDTGLQYVSIGDAYGCSNGETTQRWRGACEADERASINFSVYDSLRNKLVAAEFTCLSDAAS